MLRVGTVLAFTFFCISLAVADDKRDEKKDDKKGDATKLEGTYTITTASATASRCPRPSTRARP